jgi:hypothetical protein
MVGGFHGPIQIAISRPRHDTGNLNKYTIRVMSWSRGYGDRCTSLDGLGAKAIKLNLKIRGSRPREVPQSAGVMGSRNRALILRG